MPLLKINNLEVEYPSSSGSRGSWKDLSSFEPSRLYGVLRDRDARPASLVEPNGIKKDPNSGHDHKNQRRSRMAVSHWLAALHFARSLSENLGAQIFPFPCLVTTGSSCVKSIIVDGSRPPGPESRKRSTMWSNVAAISSGSPRNS